MAKIFEFPDFDPDTRQHYTEVKEELLKQGIFHDPEKIPPGLIHFIIEWWGTIYEAGHTDGLIKNSCMRSEIMGSLKNQ
ncbi:hypothetical protein [Elongatibacter sediminis]|uniref:Uncharacterized protein n=1 Tax=Elongatibacter sediminis TaxID=3119006 RepID=A0AAW9R842_9GAMM